MGYTARCSVLLPKVGGVDLSAVLIFAFCVLTCFQCTFLFEVLSSDLMKELSKNTVGLSHSDLD